MDATDTLKIPQTLQEAVVLYSNPQNCVAIIAAIRWPNGAVCPHCQGTESLYMPKYSRYQCKVKTCKKQFTVKMGTIFEDSPLGLDKWLMAMWLIANCKNGVSSCEIARDIDITQKSAWFMLHRIRLAMQNGSLDRLEGTCEADETFVGGKAKFMHKDKREAKINGRGSVGKAVVMGVLERGKPYIDKHGEEKKTASQVKTNVIPNTTREVLHGEVKAAVVEGAEIMTDAARGYRGLSDFYRHQFVDHAVKYAEGNVYTNGLENFWSLTKRALKGTYVSVEPGH